MHTCSFNFHYSYSIYYTQKFYELDNDILKNYLNEQEITEQRKCLVIIDEYVNKLYPSLYTKLSSYFEHHQLNIKLLDFYTLLPGEKSKNSFETLSNAYELIKDREIDRHSFIMSIGGGSTNDVAGLIASTAHRGIKHIRIPTTVLAQNDAAIGVKNGVNFQGKKNFIGTFSVPELIINDFSFLETLEPRDYTSGYAEAIKISLIKDKDFFHWIESNSEKLISREKKEVQHLIEKTAKLHTEHFAKSGDPFEKGSSRPLDYGHWLAHSLESLSGFELRHGEAVGIGMYLDTLYAYKKGYLKSDLKEQIITLLEKIGLFKHKSILEKIDYKILMESLNDFKAHLGGKLSIPLLYDIALFKNHSDIDCQMYLEIISEVLNSEN